MSPAHALLAELETRGLHVRADAGRLLVKPQSALTAELRAKVLEAKPELLRLLASVQAPALDHGLYVHEVNAFPAALLPELPLPTTLVLELDSGTLCRVATHTGCCPPFDRGCEWWLGLSGDGGATVAVVLAELGAVLRAVVIEGGKP